MRLILKSVSSQPLIDLNELKNQVSLLRKESDEYLMKILNLSIDAVEAKTDLSIRKKRWNLLHNNCVIHLTKGPVQEVLSVTDMKTKNEVVPKGMIRTGDNLAVVVDKSVEKVSVVYEAGYDIWNLPICLKNSIVDMFWKLYSWNEERVKEAEKARQKTIAASETRVEAFLDSSKETAKDLYGSLDGARGYVYG